MSSTVIEQAAPGVSVVPAPRLDSDTAWLVINRGPGTGTGIQLGAPVITIGRHRDSDISLGDSTVSRRHAEIRVDGDRYLITDIGSFNGTYVNRQLVDQVELHDGDEIWIGRHRLVFRR
jgi:pSer/pThr/pTyr-binding forkhead associated (FHA) protein